MSIYDSGILIINGFSVATAKPVDLKYIADTIQDRDNYVTNNLAYEGMLVYVKEDENTYQYTKDGWKDFGFNIEDFRNNIYDGLDSSSTTLVLSANQGKILDAKIASHANTSDIHITSDERNIWNNKAENNLATQTDNGLMSSSDKTKLDSLTVHPDTHPATMIIEDGNHRFVTDEQIASWDNKAENRLATQGMAGLMSAEDKLKLDIIDEVNGNYTHPATHDATIIVTDENHRFVTDEQIATWNNLIQEFADLNEKLKSAVFYK